MQTLLAPWQQKLSQGIDRLTLAISPRRAYVRQAYRFAYDAVDRSRLRKPRSLMGGTGDSHLDEATLSRLREIVRDMRRNNPIVKGLLHTEAKGVVGSETTVQAKTASEPWNTRAEALWKRDMVDDACDVTGRLNIHQLLNLAYKSYRGDGDDFVVLRERKLWLVEGEQCGTPAGVKGNTEFDVTNGVATRARDDGPDRPAGQVIGYYIGTPDQWGYIKGDSWRAYDAQFVHHVFNPDRVSYTRGEPILTSAIDWIDKLTRFADAKLVAAHVEALFVMALTKKFPEGILPGSRPLGSSAAVDPKTGFKQEKLDAGMIYECAPGEDAKSIAPSQPGPDFKTFVETCLSFICRPMCLPLMLATLDYSGATFMNARIAYQEAWDNWKLEQELVVKRLASRIWRWKVAQWIVAGELSPREDALEHEVVCKRWPYVDPYKEAMADQVDLENGTNTRTAIVARIGRDYRDVVREQVREKKIRQDEGLEEEKAKTGENESTDSGKDKGDGKESD